MNVLVAAVLLGNTVWFGMAFRFFSFQQDAAAGLLVEREWRGHELVARIAAGLRFLGGMNGALALLNLLVLVATFVGADLFTSPAERGALLLGFGAAHLSQFLPNLAVVRGGETLWPVRRGTMHMIYRVDLAMTFVNVAAAVAVLVAG